MKECNQFVKIMLLALNFMLLFSIASQAQPCNISQTDPTHIYCAGKLFEVKGMNYYPKDYAWDRFWPNYKTSTVSTQVNTELDLAKSLGINTLRIFVPYKPNYSFDLTDVVNFINRASQRQMKVIVTLFDLIKSTSVPYLETADSKTYLDTIINGLGSANSAILAWDIKNELDRDYGKNDPPYGGTENVKNWAREMIKYIRETRGSTNLITIGFFGEATGTSCDNISNTKIYDPTIAAEFTQDPDPQQNRVVDFVSMHYFLPERCFQHDLQALQTAIGDIPIVLEEFGTHTKADYSDPHDEDDQASYFNALLSISEALDIAGYLFWTFNDFSYILPPDIMEESHYCQGIMRNTLCNECENTTATDYTKKPAAEIIRSHYQDTIRFIDDANGWVDGFPDMPVYAAPPGWDDNQESGGLLRGYNAGAPLWSHTRGNIAFSRYGDTGLTENGKATSIVLNNIDLVTYPFLNIRVYSYGHRIVDQGDCNLLVKVKKDGTTSPALLTINPQLITLPNTFMIDLRPQLGNGIRTFQVVLELEPQGGDGYSATYELEWISMTLPPSYLLWTK